MEYTVLNNGVKMPMMGLGVFRCSAEDTFNTVKNAIECGYELIDTAAAYENEEFVGEAIKASGVKRENLFVTTKLWNEEQRKNNQRAAFEESLKKLNMDYVDLYLIHWPVKEKFCESWNELIKLYEEGLVKAIGVSNFKEHHLEELRNTSDFIPSVNQIELHPFLSQKDMLEVNERRGIKTEAWSPLGAAKNELLDNEIVVGLAQKYNKTPAQIVLRWDIECGIITIPKSSNKERQRQNIEIFDFKLLAEEVEKINSLNKNIRVGSDPDYFNF